MTFSQKLTCRRYRGSFKRCTTFSYNRKNNKILQNKLFFLLTDVMPTTGQLVLINIHTSKLVACALISIMQFVRCRQQSVGPILGKGPVLGHFPLIILITVIILIMIIIIR